MLILLPPSEGKAVGRRGKPLDLSSLSFPQLTDTRQLVLDALAEVSARPDALDLLDAPKGAIDAVAANIAIFSEPCLPASSLYTGVLYDALDWNSLTPAAKRRGARWLVVQSAAFGALRPGDKVPSYRLSGGVAFPGLGTVASIWRAALDPVLSEAAGRGAVVDCRSSTYVPLWRPAGAVAERTATIAVVRDGPGGRTAVSHMAKHTRGLVARTLLEDGTSCRSVDDVAEVLAREFCVDVGPATPGRPTRVEVVEP